MIQSDGSGRFAFGGVAHKPWRVEAAERERDAAGIARVAFAGAKPTDHNVFKVPLATRAVAASIAEARA